MVPVGMGALCFPGERGMTMGSKQLRDSGEGAVQTGGLSRAAPQSSSPRP